MVTVRPAVPADAEGVVRIHVRTWQHAYAGIMPDDALQALDGKVEERASRARERWSSPGPRRYRTLVAVDERDELMGFVTFGPYRLDPSRRDGETDLAVGEVLAIYVDPARHRAGAGWALLDAAVVALREGGAGEVRLWVLTENAPARRFYERYGFFTDGERHLFRLDRPDGTPVDLPEVRYTLPGT